MTGENGSHNEHPELLTPVDEAAVAAFAAFLATNGLDIVAAAKLERMADDDHILAADAVNGSMARTTALAWELHEAEVRPTTWRASQPGYDEQGYNHQV